MRPQLVRPLLRSLGMVTAAALLGAGATAQTTWVVDVNGPTPPGSGTRIDPYTSIQFALQQGTTVAGDALIVAPGTYLENVDFLGKDVRVISSDGHDLTIIDAAGVGSVVSATSGETASAQLEGFTLRNGRGTLEAISGEALGGGVYVKDSGLQLRDCIIEDCATIPAGGSAVDGSGGGVYVIGSSQFSIFDCEIRDNQSHRGGGIYAEDSNVLLFFSIIEDNDAVATDLNHAGIGGGLASIDCTLNFDSCAVERNEAEAGMFVPARGGGMLIWDGTGNVLNSLFADNVAGTASSTQFFGQGGGIEALFFDTPQEMQIAGCELRDNQALVGGGFFGSADMFANLVQSNRGQTGAGIYSFGIDMRDVDVIDNDALLPDEFATGLGIFTDPTMFSNVEQSSIRDHDGMGQGIGVWGGSFTSCQITGNRGVGTITTLGGGAFQADLLQCTLRDNEATLVGGTISGGQGGGMFGGSATRCTIVNNSAQFGGGSASSDLVQCTVVFNEATGASLAGGALNGTLDSCIVWDNTPQDVEALNGDFSNVGSGVVGGIGNISADPMFWQPLNNDFLLRPNSPSINTGNPLLPPDFDGSQPDMGAFAFQPNYFAAPFVYCTAKVNSQGCTPVLTTTNVPSISFNGGQFRVDVNTVLNQQNGILFWGASAAALPFQGGTLCIGPPVTRTPVQSSGGNTGTTDCSGNYSFVWTNAYTQSQNLSAGDRVFAQFWSRDPAATFGSGLSTAVDFTFIP